MTSARAVQVRTTAQ